jgi:succinyl-CoA synthetase beta subunit
MNVHEYQAKAVLRDYGVAVPHGILVLRAADALAAANELGGSVWVVKSQIHAGGRGKGIFKEEEAGRGGGVRLATSPAEVEKFVCEMLGRTLITAQTGPAGKKVNRIYLEHGVRIAKEFYLSLVVDRSAGRVAFLVSPDGGMEIEEVARRAPGRITSFSIDPATGILPHHGRRVSSALGLSGSLAAEAEALTNQLYEAFIGKDMSAAEINPLIVAADGRLLCLDAKISFDDNALYRHPGIAALRDLSEEDPKEIEAAKHELNYIALDGTIGCMVNGAGLAMATMDIIKLYGGEPANFLDVGGGATKHRVMEGFKLITSDQRVRGILVNIFGGIMKCDVIAEGIVAAVKETGLRVPLVVRLEGTNVALGKKILAGSGLNVIPAGDLEDAARKIVAAAKA